MDNNDYGYFGSGSSGYAHYTQTHKACFGDDHPVGSSGNNKLNGNDVSWASIGRRFLLAGALILTIYIIERL